MEATTKKKLLFAGLATGVLLLINRAGEAKQTINGLRFSFGIGGTPQFAGVKIIFPVKVTVTNPGDVTLPLDGVAMTLQHLALDGTGTTIAATDPRGVVTPNIKARSATDFIVPVQTDWFSIATELFGALKKGGGIGRYRLYPTIISAGIKVDIPAIILTY